MNFEIGHIDYKDSAMGKMERSVREQSEKQLAELQKLRDELDNYIAEYRAYQAAAEQREKLAEKRGFWRGVLAGVISGVIVGVFIYYWPTIVSAVSCLLHR